MLKLYKGLVHSKSRPDGYSDSIIFLKNIYFFKSLTLIKYTKIMNTFLIICNKVAIHKNKRTNSMLQPFETSSYTNNSKNKFAFILSLKLIFKI